MKKRKWLIVILILALLGLILWFVQVGIQGTGEDQSGQKETPTATELADTNQHASQDAKADPENEDKDLEQIAAQDKKDNERTDSQTGQSEQDDEIEEDDEPIKQLVGNPASNKERTIIVEIISPREPSFSPGQARLWQAEIRADEYFDSDQEVEYETEEEAEIAALLASMDQEKFKFACEWTFVLNGEDYYAQTLQPGFYIKDSGSRECKFTSSSIGLAGKLAASVNLHVYDVQKIYDEDGLFVEDQDILLETITATQVYTVQ